jgi:hypothetical protein
MYVYFFRISLFLCYLIGSLAYAEPLEQYVDVQVRFVHTSFAPRPENPLRSVRYRLQVVLDGNVKTYPYQIESILGVSGYYQSNTYGVCNYRPIDLPRAFTNDFKKIYEVNHSSCRGSDKVVFPATFRTRSDLTGNVVADTDTRNSLWEPTDREVNQNYCWSPIHFKQGTLLLAQVYKDHPDCDDGVLDIAELPNASLQKLSAQPLSNDAQSYFDTQFGSVQNDLTGLNTTNETGFQNVQSRIEDTNTRLDQLNNITNNVANSNAAINNKLSKTSNIRYTINGGALGSYEYSAGQLSGLTERNTRETMNAMRARIRTRDGVAVGGIQTQGVLQSLTERNTRIAMQTLETNTGLIQQTNAKLNGTIAASQQIQSAVLALNTSNNANTAQSLQKMSDMIVKYNQMLVNQEFTMDRLSEADQILSGISTLITQDKNLSVEQRDKLHEILNAVVTSESGIVTKLSDTITANNNNTNQLKNNLQIINSTIEDLKNLGTVRNNELSAITTALQTVNDSVQNQNLTVDVSETNQKLADISAKISDLLSDTDSDTETHNLLTQLKNQLSDSFVTQSLKQDQMIAEQATTNQKLDQLINDKSDSTFDSTVAWVTAKLDALGVPTELTTKVVDVGDLDESGFGLSRNPLEDIHIDLTSVGMPDIVIPLTKMITVFALLKALLFIATYMQSIKIIIRK